MIKILYFIFIFLLVRFALKAFKSYFQMISTNNTKQGHQKNDDIIDAEYTVVEEHENK